LNWRKPEVVDEVVPGFHDTFSWNVPPFEPEAITN
jgi:hypothetical protein